MRFLLLIVLILLLSGCDFEPRDVTFYVWEDECWTNGRFLNVNQSDSVQLKEMPDSAKRYGISQRNLLCREKENLILESDSDWRYSFRIWPCFPIRVHRVSGRVDTLYCFTSCAYVCVGYISAYTKSNGWLVLESKVPGKILGHEYLAQDKYKEYDTLSLQMYAYSYAGQERIFATRKVDYWIASQHTYDIFGPMTRKELKAQLQELHIPLPLKLDGIYDRYVHVFPEDSLSPAPKTPKAFYWPNHREREDVVIE